MRIDANKSRVGDPNETARERELRGKVEKLERTVEELKRRLPLQPQPNADEIKQSTQRKP